MPQFGTALMRIRDERLYRQRGYQNRDTYCGERWGWDRSYVHRQIQAARVAQNLLPIGNIRRNQAQARELVQLTPQR